MTAADEDGGTAAWAALHRPPACGARLRGGGTCQRRIEIGRRRCLQHGGGPRTGAPVGNQNALKHGAYTKPALARRRAIGAFVRDCLRTLREIEKG